MPYKDSEKKKEWMKEYNPSYYQNHKSLIDDRHKIICRQNRIQLRYEVLSHYSNGQPRCACCGEMEVSFLTIDHIHNNGAEHRKQINCSSGWQFYYWLRRNGFPEGFQVLCMNCNWGKRMNKGICPHQAIKVIKPEAITNRMVI